MNLKHALLAAVFAASPAAGVATGAHANESAYTDRDLDACKTLSEEEEGPSVTLQCAGYKDLSVTFKEGDLRQSQAYGPMSRAYIDGAFETFGPFNHTGAKIEWRLGAGETPPPATREETDCLATVASIRITTPAVLVEGAYGPFGVQLAGNTSKARAIASYQRVAARFASLLAGKPTMILGSAVPGRGRGRFYRVRLPAQSLREATLACNRLRQAGGACLVLRN